MQRFAVSGFREIQNDLNVVLEGGDASGGDAVAQEIQLGNGEDALLQVEGQAIGGEDGEQRAEVVQCSSLDLLKTPSSSKKEKTYSKPIKILSLSRWRACAAFLSPKAMNKNSHNPNGLLNVFFSNGNLVVGFDKIYF